VSFCVLLRSIQKLCWILLADRGHSPVLLFGLPEVPLTLINRVSLIQRPKLGPPGTPDQSRQFE
jgi:hypothetical protein